MHMHTARWMLPTSWVWKSALKHCFTNTKPLTEMKHGYLATHLSLGHPCCSLPWPHGGGGNRKLPGKIGMAWHAPIRQCLITVCLCWDTSIYSVYSCVFSDEHQDLRSYHQIIFTAFSRNVWNRRNCLHPKDQYLERSTWRLQYLLFDCLASWCSKEARTHAVLQQNIFDKNLLF
jgi:hypothetical protein